jgi:hypothetical protein
MRLFLCVLSFSFLFPSVGSAQATYTKIGIYSDLAASVCSVSDVAGPRTLHVVHKFNVGSLSSSFRIEYSAGMTGAWVSSSSLFAVTGDPLTGTTVTYGGCLIGDQVILDLEFLFYGTSPPCSWIRVADDAEAVDCGSNLRVADWLGIHVDPDFGCWCPSYFTDEHFCPNCKPYSPPVSVSTTTWGQIKALYR